MMIMSHSNFIAIIFIATGICYCFCYSCYDKS